jgi:hypothetical protein
MDKEQILEQQKIKAARLKEKRELEERIVKAKIRKGGWQGFRLYIHGVF